MRHGRRLAAPAIAAVDAGPRAGSRPPSATPRATSTGCGEKRDWCISRQLWWGHRIPIWYRGDEVHVGDERPRRARGGTRDEDVLDTWFSSASGPSPPSGWPERTPELEKFYPTQVLSTARDIIILWVARMVIFGQFTGDDPFSRRLHPPGDPGRRTAAHEQVARQRHRPGRHHRQNGADALRFGLLMMSSTQDVRFSADRIDQGRQLVTKLWNATRLVVDRGGRAGVAPPPAQTLADRWIASRVDGGRRAGRSAHGGRSGCRSSPTSSTTWSSTTTATGTWSC